MTQILPIDTKGSIRDVFDEIVRERMAQDAEWGGPSHDDTHSNVDWCTYINKHNARAANGLHDYRYQMIRIAALAIAAIQAFDRNEGVRESNNSQN